MILVFFEVVWKLNHYIAYFFIFRNVRLYRIDLYLPLSFFLLGIECFHSYRAYPIIIAMHLLFNLYSCFFVFSSSYKSFSYFSYFSLDLFLSIFSKTITHSEDKLRLTIISVNKDVLSTWGLIPWPGSYSLMINWSNSISFLLSIFKIYLCELSQHSNLFLIWEHHSGIGFVGVATDLRS